MTALRQYNFFDVLFRLIEGSFFSNLILYCILSFYFSQLYWAFPLKKPMYLYTDMSFETLIKNQIKSNQMSGLEFAR